MNSININSFVHSVAELVLRFVDPMQKRAEWLGRGDGKRNAHDPGLTESEQSIIVYYRHRQHKLKARYLKLLQPLAAQLSGFRQRIGNLLGRLVREASTQLLVLRRELQGPLVAANAQERQAERELSDFRYVNRLDRSPVYPEALYLIYAALAAMVVIEALANMWVFALASEIGLVGGILQSGVVAALNVTVAFSAGVALRYVNHRAVPKEGIGVLVGMSYLGFLGAFALMLGHYRMALLANPTKPEKAVIEAVMRFVDLPFAIYDLHALMLMVVTIVFALAALRAGWSSRDPYPGYMEIHQAHRRAVQQLGEQENRYTSAIKSVFRGFEQVLAAAPKQVLQLRDAYWADLAETERLVSRYEGSKADIAFAAGEALRRYRAAYRQVQNSAEPVHFPEQPAFYEPSDVIDIQSLGLKEAKDFAQGLEECIEAIEDEAEGVRAKLDALYRQAFDETPAFFAECKALAERKLPPQRPQVDRHPDDQNDAREDTAEGPGEKDLRPFSVVN